MGGVGLGLEGSDEVVDVGFVVVEMQGEAEAAVAGGGEDFVFFEAGEEGGGGDIGEVGGGDGGMLVENCHAADFVEAFVEEGG